MDNFDIASLFDMIGEMVARWGFQLVGAIAVLLVGRLVARWVRRLVTAAMEKANMDPTLVPFLSGMLYWGVNLVVLVAVFGMVGIQTASILTVLGAASLAIGLALQGTLANFAAGVMLLVFRPFRVGDFVEVNGQAGAVRGIKLFSTELNTPDNVQIVIPNSAVWGNTIKNYAANDTRRNDMVVGISYDDDIQVALDTITDILAADERVLADPAPVVAVSELGNSSVNIVVRPWCTKEDYWTLRFHLMRAFKERIEAAGCSIPYPQQDVHVRNYQIAS